MEGYGRSAARSAISSAISANGADDLAAATDYIAKAARGVTRFADVWHLVRRVACGALHATPRASGWHGSHLDAFVWTGEGAPTLVQRRKKLPEFLASKRRPIDRKFVHSIFDA